MTTGNRSTFESARPHKQMASRTVKAAFAFVTVLVSAMLGGMLLLSSHGVGGATHSAAASATAPHDSPMSLQAPGQQIFVGTVPEARPDEHAITPMETVGAAPD